MEGSVKNKFSVIILFVALIFIIKIGHTEPNSPAFQFGYGNIYDITSVPDSSKLAVGTTYGVEFLDSKLNRSGLINLPSPAESIAFRPDGKQLAVVSEQKVYIWNEDYSNYVILNTKKANSVYFSPNGELLVLCIDGKIEFWNPTELLSDFKTNKPNKVLKRHNFSVNCVDFSPDGNFMVSGGDDKSIHIWNVISFRELKSFYRQPGEINSVAFLDDNRIIVASSQAVRVLDISTGNVLKVLINKPQVNFYASKKSGIIATVSENGEIDVWSSKLEHLLNRQSYIDTNSILFSQDGQSIITGSKFYAIDKWSLPSGEKIATRKGVFIECLEFHPDGKTVVLGGFEAGKEHKDGQIIIFDLINGKEIKRLNDHIYPVDVFRFSPDGTQFLSWSTKEANMILWKPNTWKKVDSLKTKDPGKIPFDYDLNEDDKYILLSGEDKLTLWDANFDVYDRPNWPRFPRSSIFRVSSFDGKFYALADGKDITFVFPNKQFSMRAHQNIIKHLQISSDAKYLASISWKDNVCLIWDLKALRTN